MTTDLSIRPYASSATGPRGEAERKAFDAALRRIASAGPGGFGPTLESVQVTAVLGEGAFGRVFRTVDANGGVAATKIMAKAAVVDELQVSRDHQ